jgi:hypothetical protein
VSKPAAPQPTDSSNSKTAPPETGARRPSYAEVTASKPSSTDDKANAKATTSSTFRLRTWSQGKRAEEADVVS